MVASVSFFSDCGGGKNVKGETGLVLSGALFIYPAGDFRYRL